MQGPTTPRDVVFSLEQGAAPHAGEFPALVLTLPHAWLPAALWKENDRDGLTMPEYVIDLREVLTWYLTSETLRLYDAEDARATLVEWATWLRTYATRLEQVLEELAPVEDC